MYNELYCNNEKKLYPLFEGSSNPCCLPNVLKLLHGNPAIYISSFGSLEWFRDIISSYKINSTDYVFSYLTDTKKNHMMFYALDINSGINTFWYTVL